MPWRDGDHVRILARPEYGVGILRTIPNAPPRVMAGYLVDYPGRTVWVNDSDIVGADAPQPPLAFLEAGGDGDEQSSPVNENMMLTDRALFCGLFECHNETSVVLWTGREWLPICSACSADLAALHAHTPV